MVRGRTQDIPIATNPAGAECRLIHLTSKTESQTVKTPGAMILPRKKRSFVECSLDGYKTAQIIITPEEHFGMYGLFNLGIIGGMSDRAMGGPYILKPEKVELTFAREGLALPEAIQTWETARSGSAEDQYIFLRNIDRNAAEIHFQSLTERQADALTKYILREKGRIYELSKNFKIFPDLDENEQTFVRWYVSKYSGYAPK